MNAIGRLVLKPNIRDDIIVQVRAIMIIGFLPTLSDALPHDMPTKAWDNENTKDNKPAYFAIELVGTLNDLIISGMYG